MEKRVRHVHLRSKLHERGEWHNRRYVFFPWLNVSGKWLEKAGFRTGDQVAIEVSDGKLTITKAHGDGATGN